MPSYISTDDAILDYLKHDPEWCRLSDAFHSISLPILDRHTPEDQTYGNRKENARAQLKARQKLLVDEVYWDVAQGMLPVLFLAESMIFRVPDSYLASSELPVALESGRASHLRIASQDRNWSNARLVFSASVWQQWLARFRRRAGSVEQPTGMQDSTPTPEQLEFWLEPIVSRVVADGRQLTHRQLEALIRKKYPEISSKDLQVVWRKAAPQEWQKPSQGNLPAQKRVADPEEYAG